MSGIWLQPEHAANVSSYTASSDCCLFCMTPMACLDEKLRVGDSDEYAIKACPACGWWNCIKVERSYKSTRLGSYSSTTTWGACAVLKKLSLADVSTPIDEVRSYLIAKYDERHAMHPRLFEETVGSIFGSVGYRVRVTAYSRDGGIDAVLDDAGDAPIAIQVKRYRNSIEVSQIREFCGALLLAGYTRGVFVTTSQFTAGSKAAAAEADNRGMAVELVDAQRFYDALKICQRPPYASIAEWRSVVGEPVYQCIDSTGPIYEP